MCFDDSKHDSLTEHIAVDHRDASDQIHVLLVDGLNIIRRVHAGVPGDPESDAHFEAVKNSTLASIRKALRRHRPTHAALINDGQGESWRKERFPEYKAGRTPMAERLRVGLPDLCAAISKLGVKTIEVDGYEADDTIATMAVAIASAGRRVTVLSSDKHFGQIVGPRLVAFDHFTERLIDTEAVVQRFAVKPEELSTFFALTGDSGVNVPGVKGVGPKTAAKLVNEHQALEAILQAAEQRNDAVGERLRQHADAARFAAHLLALRLDVPVGVNLKDLRIELS